MTRIRIAQAGYIVSSVIFYIAAALFLFFNRISSPVFGICSGVFLLAYGVIKIIGYFSEDLYCLAFRYDLAFGILLLVLGAIVLSQFTAVGTWLPLGCGWLALLDSVMKVQMAQEAKKFGLEQWNVMLATAVIAGTLGVTSIFQNIMLVQNTHILTALVLLSVGIMNHYSAVFAVKYPQSRSMNEKNNEKDKEFES